ncbi:putative aldehyde dehydrogenase AldA [Roseovarius sp. A-2]|nr:putative aldehyde dehydrogenase AldA [Roseovarius sp. A-2]
MADVNPYWQNYIDGAWVDGGAGRIEVTDPTTGERIAEHALADTADADRAAQAARRVHLSGALTAMGRYLLEHRDEIVSILRLEQGKPLWEAHIEFEGAALYFVYYGNQASTVEGRSIPLESGYMDWTEYEPFDVSAQIIPWNYPIEMTARSLSAALSTGNACVIKSPEMTPLTNAYLARAAKAAGFPPGAVNVICGLGRDAGAALAGRPDVNQIVFTGSVPTGIAIATAAAQNVVPCVLELGGKSAAIVHDDADLDAFENDIRWGIYFNTGQVCSAMSRVIVHESRRDELIERAEKVAKSLSVGPGIERNEFGANMGSMVSDGQRDRAVGIIETAQSKGAGVVTGGRPLNRPGAFLEPTVLAGMTPGMEIATKGVFGPVLSVLSFRDDAQAIKIDNSTDYGLVGDVFTTGLNRAPARYASCAPVRSLSTNGTQAALKRPLAVTANPAMAANRAARRYGTTCKPRTSRSG